MSDCLFCKISNKEIPAKVEYEDDDLIVIHDINPQAAVHILLIPKRHIDRIDALQDGDAGLMGTLLIRAKDLAQKNGWEDFRLVFNNGAAAGQTVFHIHMHLLTGRPMGWPPG
ncbi:MAG: histidine triad nucleotide-binding protein [Candidatus Omnitrophota bacterium]|nr:histidine triad nucleotide-binding protein [Candidatus Omnitrophota bacterium]